MYLYYIAAYIGILYTYVILTYNVGQYMYVVFGDLAHGIIVFLLEAKLQRNSFKMQPLNTSRSLDQTNWPRRNALAFYK